MCDDEDGDDLIVAHGMSEQEMAKVNALRVDINDLIGRIHVLLPRHRNYSLATTKLEEALLWLRDRYSKTVE